MMENLSRSKLVKTTGRYHYLTGSCSNFAVRATDIILKGMLEFSGPELGNDAKNKAANLLIQVLGDDRGVTCAGTEKLI